MARSTNRSTSSVRSEFNASEEIGKSGESFTRSFYISELGNGLSVRNTEGRGVSDKTIKNVSNSLGRIEQKIIPTKKITLAELSKNNPRAYDRFNSVINDNNIGDAKVYKEFYESKTPFKTDEERKYVVKLANEVMREAYLNNKRDFSNWAKYNLDVISASLGKEKAGQMVDLALREGYNRMQRAGMTYQEKDPRKI